MKRSWAVTAALVVAYMAGTHVDAQSVRVPETVQTGMSAAAEATAPSHFAESGTPASGPLVSSASIAPRLDISGESTDALAAPRRPFGLSQTLMIVGGAAFIAGAIVGDDAGAVMMVAGAGVGLYGLYLYLREPPGSMNSRSIGVGYRLPVSP